MLKIIKTGIRKYDYISEELKKSQYNYIVWDKKDMGIIYNTYSGAVAHISKLEWEHECLSEEDKVELITNGFLVPVNVDEISSVINSIKGCKVENPTHFTIIPTTSCNARCFYCYEECYKKETMSEKTISNLSKYIVSNISNEFILDLYGGEPLLCVEMIDKLINQIKNSVDLYKLNWYSVITTNASLFSPELVDHVVDEWNLKVAHITIDGNESEHNIRKNIKGINSFRQTKRSILMLLKKNVYVNLRIHLDKNNYLSLESIFSEIKEFFKYENFRAFPTYLFPPENNDDSSQYFKDSEKEELFSFVFKTMLELGLIDNLVQLLPVPKNTSCSAMNSKQIVIAPDGSFHRCVQEFSGNDFCSDEKFLSISIQDMCVICKDLPICLGGCRHNYEKKGTMPCMRSHYIIMPLLKLLLGQN